MLNFCQHYTEKGVKKMAFERSRAGNRKEPPMSLKVLIADPDWRFARQAAAFLESHAHHVVREPRGDRAMELVRHWAPDLVIASEELSEAGLLEALYAIPDRPAVLLVGWMDRYDKVWKAWQLGGDELLMKPVFDIADLHNAIVVALENAAVGARRAEAIPA
jgi:DNA-binding response OmpR family regulator